MKAFILSGLLAATVSAHMQLSSPYPIRSPLNKDAKGEKDYSYTNPLSSSGSDYPCKGYANDDFEAVATWAPGSSQEMQLEGSATHDGGSCQLALTYDKGKTFKVIESIEGDCPIAKKYKFEVPSDAPAGDALFAWTWFNKVGNREMYMNCAMVSIGGSGNRNTTQSTEDRKVKMAPKHKVDEKHEASSDEKQPAPKAHDHKDTKKTKNAKTSFDSLPELFVANVNQAGKCVTIEGQAVHFPKPGPNLVGKAEGKGYKCSGNAPFLDSDGASNSTNSTNSTNTTNTSKKISKVAQAFGTAPATADTRVLVEASTNNPFSDYVGRFRCQSGELICSPDGSSFAMCTHGKPVFMGPVAAGTVCRWGTIVAAH
ncbi:uncharacterized protein N7515_010253 [Penicillium bovifimosum]|uniref:Extracellular protein n=1 Tax=Penicillium bovifimosum TaxID=126998 RepID=A0A9W9GIG6_9EURO|nr:uncharacterized protein N7515_010253 [Penicillium bovifimosum]KAJ5120865.1 hypothetical protein N7515_010253 [Penicillium bovifimosum]